MKTIVNTCLISKSGDECSVTLDLTAIDLFTGHIEFFKCGKRCFGGDIEAQVLQDLSYETLEEYFSDFPFGKLKDIADSFKVRGWKPDANFDAVFDVDACGKIAIKINNT